MVNNEKEIFQFVEHFKKEFNRKFGFLPYVIFANNPTQSIISRIPIEDVISVAEACLQEDLKEIGKKSYRIMSTPKCRESIDYKHAVYKVLYDIGYNPAMIANYFGVKRSNVSLSITKVENFIDMRDPIFMNILNKIENGLKKQNIQSVGNVQQDSGRETNS